MDDGFGIMVVSGCRAYVTEPVDMVLVCDWSCAVCSRVGRCILCTVLWWWFVLGGILYDSVDDIG